jgi:hypothetical protein
VSISVDLTQRQVQVDKYMTVCEDLVAKDVETAIRIRQAASGISNPEGVEAGVGSQLASLTAVEHIYLTSDLKDYYKYWLLERDNASKGGELALTSCFMLRTLRADSTFLNKEFLLIIAPKTSNSAFPSLKTSQKGPQSLSATALSSQPWTQLE